MTDIRERAEKAAREWRSTLPDRFDTLHGIGEAAFAIGYEAGYRAAKAEALVAYAATRLKKHGGSHD